MNASLDRERLLDVLSVRIQSEEAKLVRFNFSARTRQEIENRIALLKVKLEKLQSGGSTC